jgi:lipopolysaccharide export system ATP-binding protein
MQIYLENICKRYGRREVVSDVSLNIQQGEIVGLLGPNGAGENHHVLHHDCLIQPNRGQCLVG